MKRLLTLFLCLAMVISAVGFPTAALATETADTTTEKVHFNIDFEDYASTDKAFPKADETHGYGYWQNKMASAGEVIQGEDGNAFKITKAAETGMYNRYTFNTPVTSGKLLLSFDMKYNTAGTAGRQTWMFFNGSSYIYLVGLENPNGSNGPSLGAVGTSSSTQKILFNAANSDRYYNVDVLLDLDSRTKTFYVDGVQQYTCTYSETDLATKNLTGIKFNLNANVAAIDNFKLVENPKNFDFEVKNATTEDEYVTVKFSDPMGSLATTDFGISSADGTKNISVSSVTKVDGKTYKLKLAQKLEAGEYKVSLTNASLASLIGTTQKNASAGFNVKSSITYFDMDFERPEKFGIESYVAEFDDYGTWNVTGSAKILQNNENRFANDETYGVYAMHETDSAATRTLAYTLTQPVTDGKVIISFDGAFDSTINKKRTQMLYINNNANNGNLLTYGTGVDDTANSTVIAGTKTDMHYSGGTTFSYEDNKAYRWDTVIDLDKNTVTNYCDGTAFNTVTLKEELASVSSVYLRFNTSIAFFDNFKVTYNKNSYDIKATDIGSKSNETIVEFGDTMSDGSVALSFTAPDGSAATVESVTKITPRRYKVAFTDLVEGVYTGSVSAALVSAIGNTPSNNTFTFKVEERPVTKTEYVEYKMIRQHPKVFDFEGAVASPQKYTDTDGVTKVTYNDTIWKVSGGPNDGHVYALTNTELKQNGKSSVELRSTDNSTMCAFYANRFWMGKQGEPVSGSVWVYWPSTTTSQYFYLEVANYTSAGQQAIIAKSAKLSADSIEKDKWVQIPINPIDGQGIDAALQVKIRFKGTEPIYVDNLSLGTVEEYPYGYYVTDASHTIEDGTVTANATIKRRSYYGDGAVIFGAIYDANDAVVGVQTFECDADEKEVSFSADTDNFKMAKWFIMENDGSVKPVGESKADRKTSFKILCHNVGKYSQGTGAGVPTAELDEATQIYLDFLNEVDADVFCAQEHAHYFDNAETVTATDQVFGKVYDYNFKSSETKAYVYQGQAIYSKIPFKDTGMGDLPTDFEGRDQSQRGYTKAVIEIDGKEVAIFNSHFSLGGVDFRNPSREILIEEMNKYEYAILCMDANSGYKEWQQFLDAGYVLGNGHNGEFITTTLKDDDLRNTEDRHFVGSGSIDQILVSPTLEIKNFTSIFNSVYSDHLPITAEIAFK